MIGRVWRGWTKAADAGAYAEHPERATLPALAELDGHRGATSYGARPMTRSSSSS